MNSPALARLLDPAQTRRRKPRKRGGFDANSVMNHPGEKPMSAAGAGATYAGFYAAGRKNLPHGKQTV